MLTGRLPFAMDPLETDEEFGDRLLRLAPIPVRRFRPNLPPWLESVLLQGMIRDPCQRITSVEQFCRLLAAGQG
jgi:hypothetical protein